MRARWWWLPVALAGGCAGGTGGASGTNLTSFDGGDVSESSPGSTSGAETTSISATADETSTAPGPTSVADDSASAHETTGPPSDSSSGTDEGSTGEGSSSTGTEELECPQDTTCPTALVIGTVSGDETSPLLNTTGVDPTWVTFHVTEDNDGIGGESLSFTATLTSPPCCDFDLYVYLGPEGGSSGCGGTATSSTSVGAVDVMSNTWGEGAVADGGDDSAWVAIEIVPKNDECDPLEMWDLTIEGDT